MAEKGPIIYSRFMRHIRFFRICIYRNIIWFQDIRRKRKRRIWSVVFDKVVVGKMNITVRELLAGGKNPIRIKIWIHKRLVNNWSYVGYINLNKWNVIFVFKIRCLLRCEIRKNHVIIHRYYGIRST